MSNELDAVRTIAAERRALEARYRGALQAARDAGHAGAAIGEAAGTTRQNVLKLTTAPVVDVRAERLEELDARWDRFVDELAAAFFVNPDAKREQLRRNTENGKRKRKSARAESAARKRGFVGRAALDLVPTVNSEGRRAAETFALRYLEEHSLEPICVKVTGELDEAARLRESLAASTDPSWLHD